jgi:heptosyltransferase III
MPFDTEVVPESVPSRATSRANSHLPKKVLVFHVGSLGDTLVSLPALTLIREQWPGASITMLYAVTAAGVASPERVLQASGLIDSFEHSPIMRGSLKRLKAFLSLWFRLVRKRYGAVVYLIQGERLRLSIFRDWLFFTACFIPRRIGFFAFRQEEFIKDESGQSYHQADMLIRRVRNDRNVREAAGPYRLNLPEAVRQQARQALSTLHHYPEQRPVAVCPGCKKPASAWPAERFVEICRRLRERDFDIILLGGLAEIPLGKQIHAEIDGMLNFCGKTSVLESAALLAECAFTVGVDTGTTHLAAAVGTPCVTLFSAIVAPGRWNPLGNGHIILRQSPPPPCAGCNEERCPIPEHPCMRSIDVDTTWGAVARMVERLGMDRSRE